MNDVICSLPPRTVGGFDLRWHALVEYEDPCGCFASGEPELDAELLRKIENGDYLWFTACVVATKNGIELARDYLGACCYDSLEQFVALGDGYAGDMEREVIDRARAAIASLAD